MTGFEFATNIKRIKPEVMVLLMTAYRVDSFEDNNILSSLQVNEFL
jgi:two-component SAPR family response regulator